MHLPLATAEFDRSGNHLTVYLSGELDQESAPALTGSILRHMQPSTEVVWIDVTAVTFCGSAGVSMFLHVGQEANQHGTRMTLYEPAPNVLRVLEMCDLDEVLSIRASSRRRPAATA